MPDSGFWFSDSNDDCGGVGCTTAGITIVGVSAGSLSTCAGACSGASTATGSVVGVVGTAVTVSAAMASVAVEASGFAEASAVSATSVSAAGATGVVAVAASTLASASAAVAVGLAKDWADSVTDSSVEDSGSDVGSANSGRPFQTRLYFSMLAFTAVRSRARLDCEDWTATYTNRSLLSTRTR